MFERFLLLWLCLLSLAAYAWGTVVGALGLPSGWDPFVQSAPYLNGLFAVTMFAIGWMLPRDEVAQIGRRWPTVFAGTLLQYTSMPLLAWMIGRLLGLDNEAMVGIMLVGCVPGAMASNVLTLAARGNVSYSVCLTTSATLLSPLVVPAAMWLALSARVEVDVIGMSWQLAWMVVLPVVFGHLLGRRLRDWEAIARRVGSTLANLVILWIIAVVVGLHRQELGGVTPVVLAALLALNALGYLAGWGGGTLMRLPQGMRRALTLEVGMQNAGLGTVLATEFFDKRSLAAIVPALYTFGCMATGVLLARGWAVYSDYRTRRQPAVATTGIDNPLEALEES